MRQPFFKNRKFPLRVVISRISQRPFLYFICIEILIIGRWAEECFGNNFFSRSGAVVALVALGILWLWLHYGKSLEETKSYVDTMKKIAGNNSDFHIIISNVSRSNKNMRPEFIYNTALLAHEAQTQGPKLIERLQAITNSLGLFQIEIAAIGTFVWAFGDLLL
jgi:hypothetical protein